MRERANVVSIMLIMMLLACAAACNAGQMYEHPALKFRFEASPDWIRVSRPEDDMIYEMMDPDSIVHAILWYTSTMQDAPRYLVKMADMKGLVLTGKPLKIGIERHDAWMFDAPVRINGIEARTLLAVIEHGKSMLHPEENALYIVQIWCPEGMYEKNARRMKDILESVEITEPRAIRCNQKTYHLYPALLDRPPDVPSPFTAEGGMEIVICFTNDGRYCLIPVTIENGRPLNYRNNQWWGKGRQLEVDTLDFPALAGTGLHSDGELRERETITGKPVSDITRDARPGAFSGAGFLGREEDIISVLRGDNELVKRLGATHPELAEPLFHVFNVILTVRKDSDRGNVGGILYNQREIHLRFGGAKGWQESIFDDEILGYWWIEIWREIDSGEEGYLSRAYPNLPAERTAELKRKLSFIHTGEMVPYYIMRYGFYEGHTDYRADPISIAFIFGLRSLEEIEAAYAGRLHEILTMDFVGD